MDKEKLDLIEKEMEKLDFPEDLFNSMDMSEESKEFCKANWSGNPEKFQENMERALGICIKIVDEERGIMEVTKVIGDKK